MPPQTVRTFLFLIFFVFASAAHAQSPALPEIATVPISNYSQIPQLGETAKRTLFVVTFDRPNRRQICRVKSYTAEKLVCSRAIGRPRTYPTQQILALIVPGDAGFKIRFVVGANVALGAAVWGTVVLAATCPPCAVATGIAALLIFGAAGAVLIGDDQPNQLLYLAPGQQLSDKLGFVQPLAR